MPSNNKTGAAADRPPREHEGSLHPKLAWTIAMFPIMTGLALGLFMAIVEEMDRSRNEWMLLILLLPVSITPVAVWFGVWGGAVRWRGVRPVIATFVIGGLGLMIVAAFALALSGWIFAGTVVVSGGPFIAVVGVAALTLGCGSPPPDESPGAVVCPECLYDLHMQQVCRCPECGTEFTLEELIAPEEQPLPVGLYER